MATGPSDPHSLWEVVNNFGGEWMWEGVDNPNRPDDMTWLVDGMKNNTITWCTDISYHREFPPKVSGAGCIALCTKTDNRMTGNFFEIPDDSQSNWVGPVN